MPLTKCQRADIKPKVEDKDYMHGIAALAGVGMATVYWMIAVLRYLPRLKGTSINSAIRALS